MKKHICLLATGGTIVCEEGADGLRPVLTGAELLRAVPELVRFGEIDTIELFSLDSSNLLPAHWQRMAQAIAERCGQYDGFVLTHGTDTMGYTAGALYYMLRGIGVPVALTGSMLPLTAAGTDAEANLRGAFAVAASGRAGVYQAFAGRIIAGNAVKKVDSTARDAFRSIGRPQAGTFALADGALTWQVPEEARAEAAKMDDETQAAFAAQFALDERVAVVKLVPGTEPRLLTALADAGYRAVIIEGYGAGGVPTAAAVALLYLIVNQALGNVLEPRVMGTGFGVSPVVVLLSVLFWGWVLGAVGMLFAVPLTMAVRGALRRGVRGRFPARGPRAEDHARASAGGRRADRLMQK